MLADTAEARRRHFACLLNFSGLEEFALQGHEAPQGEQLGVDPEPGVAPRLVHQPYQHFRHAVVRQQVAPLPVMLRQHHQARPRRRQLLQRAAAVQRPAARVDRPRQRLGRQPLLASTPGTDELAQRQQRPRPPQPSVTRMARKGGVERPLQVLLECFVDQLAGLFRNLHDPRAVVSGTPGALQQTGQHHLQLRHQGRRRLRRPGVAESPGKPRRVARGETPGVARRAVRQGQSEGFLDRRLEDPRRVASAIVRPRPRRSQRH